MSIVLMYHGLYTGNEPVAIDSEDLPYAVSEVMFRDQLDVLQEKRVGLFRDTQIPDVVLTFDDGHASNLEIAAPLLQDRGMSAYFFITTDYIGKRPGFMSAKQVSSLSQIPGMCIGSHGASHRFLDDLSAEEAREELVSSRNCLESITGKSCESLSFPGGRFNSHTLKLLEQAGYRQWFGSEVGTVIVSERFVARELTPENQLLTQIRLRPLERVAVRRSTSMQEFARITGPDQDYLRQHKRRSRVKFLCRRLLGNRLYHGLYKSLSAR